MRRVVECAFALLAGLLLAAAALGLGAVLTEALR